MTRDQFQQRRKRWWRTQRLRLHYLEVWINCGIRPHAYVRHALNLPRTIDEARAEARVLSHTIWR